MDQAIDNALTIFEQTLCDIMPASGACRALQAGEHPAKWATKPVRFGTGEGAQPASTPAAGGGIVGAGVDKAMETAWRSPSDDELHALSDRIQQ
eukprot:CAMPEP_0185553522 /NCGR_PEP_ID=MMETSP1381-20130426/38194_1 /TAXON_ID=298111 /ORGANISM="Pavlova sp., Strain CCMP459" /LENGTH=93 /DNA_ID=CAMNT_0028166639 /DNA_START=12 /DNA_END=291 /DNA_ORIENTATION=+